MLTPEFDEHVRDALVHYGDSARLCASPLLDRLSSPHLAMEDRLGELRAALRRAIESLRPPESVPFGHTDWLPYRVLWGRCIQRRSPILICDELGLSRATFYRYQAQAIQAVCRVLWEEVGAPDGGLQSPDERHEAPQLAAPPGHERIDLPELLAGVQADMHALLERQHVTLHVELSDDVPPIYGDPATLRQVVLNALAGVLRATTGPTLVLSVSAAAGETVWEIRAAGVDGAPPPPASDEYPELDLCGVLLEPYGGRIAWATDEAGLALRFTLPAPRPPTVLVVEDDQDTIALYERHLRRAGYEMHVARDGAQLQQALEKGQPDLIVLDVLMPQEDGWMVLQRLQTLPETAGIPVIVCSVLAQPSLALSLGAQQVLLKPVTEASLLQAIRRALAPEDSAPQPHR